MSFCNQEKSCNIKAHIRAYLQLDCAIQEIHVRCNYSQIKQIVYIDRKCFIYIER